MGDIASINFKPVKANSTRHNERIGELDYVFSDLTQDNASWKVDEIQNRYNAISELTKEKTGRKIQAKATPIREAVVNLKPNHTIECVKQLTNSLKKEYGLDAFQIHIHRDEGKSREELNFHAHILFDWQDKETGKSFKLNRKDMSRIQDITAEALDMSRGELKENSNTKRLEAVEYKRHKEEERVKNLIPQVSKLQEEVHLLEQKKNEAERKYYSLARQNPELDIFTSELAKDTAEENESFKVATIKQLEEAIQFQLKYIEGARNEEQQLAQEILEVEQGIKAISENRERIRRGYEEAKRISEVFAGEVELQPKLEEEYKRLKDEYKAIKGV